MENETNDEVNVDNVEENNEGEGEVKVEKPKRTPQEELKYFEGRAARIRKDLGLDVEKTETKKETTQNSNEFGYAEKAFLTASGLKGSKEFELAQKFAKETGKNLEQVLESKYFQNELEDMREIDRTANASIRGKDGKGMSIDSVEYWASKDFKDVPREMKAKVVEFQLKKEKEKDVFYNSK